MPERGRSAVWFVFFCFLLVLRAEAAAPCLDPDFQRWIDDKRAIDLFAAEQYQADKDPPQPQKMVARRTGIRRGVVRVVTNRVDARLVQAWKEIPAKTKPLPAFRAGAFDDGLWRMPANATDVEKSAAKLIQDRLRCDGLLATAIEAIQALGETHGVKTIESLRRIGFPVDLLRFFHSTSGESILDVIESGRTNDLTRAVFRFEATAPGFVAAVESGESELTLARVQIGGGFRGGIVPGSSFDVAGKLVEALPETKFVVSLDEEFLGLVYYQAQSSWPLRRLNQLTLIGEPLPVSGWAQDNGKGGMVREASGKTLPAILAPRYASMGEDESLFMPGESFLLTGLIQTGVRVFHSGLLFQGGNLLVVRDPARNQRLLLISQSEINRNLALGLTAPQIEEAFKTEFSVDRCIVLPLVSYHLDYDLTCRAVGNQLVAFVNDPVSLSRMVVRRGAAALAKAGAVPAEDANTMIRALETSDEARRALALADLIERARSAPGSAPSPMVAAFKVDAMDSGSANLACFCVGLDWLICASPEDLPATISGARREYLGAMRRKLARLAEQKRALEKDGFRTVAIPSMPDLQIGMNYLNGIHDRSRFLMPAYGGFYQGADELAVRSFAAVFGPKIRVIPIPCADMQWQHGALHCMVSIFPAEAASP